MATQIKFRRGTTAQHSGFTGADGEITVDTDKETAVVHNNSTAGGFPLAREDMNNVSNPQFSGTSTLKLPIGTTAQRPGSPSNGQVRVNSTTGRMEVYDNGEWINASACRAYGLLKGTATVSLHFDYGFSSVSTTGVGLYYFGMDKTYTNAQSYSVLASVNGTGVYINVATSTMAYSYVYGKATDHFEIQTGQGAVSASGGAYVTAEQVAVAVFA